MNKIINIYDFIVTKYPIIAIKYEVCGFLCVGQWVTNACVLYVFYKLDCTQQNKFSVVIYHS